MPTSPTTQPSQGGRFTNVTPTPRTDALDDETTETVPVNKSGTIMGVYAIIRYDKALRLARQLERENASLCGALQAFVKAEEDFRREAFDSSTMVDALADAYNEARNVLSSTKGEGEPT